MNINVFTEIVRITVKSTRKVLAGIQTQDFLNTSQMLLPLDFKPRSGREATYATLPRGLS